MIDMHGNFMEVGDWVIIHPLPDDPPVPDVWEAAALVLGEVKETSVTPYEAIIVILGREIEEAHTDPEGFSAYSRRIVSTKATWELI